MLPVAVNVGRFVTQSSQAVLAAAAARHPAFATDPSFPTWSWEWSTLPPLRGRIAGLSPTEAGAVLLASEGEPLAVAGAYGKGRVLVFGGLTYWRWDMIPRGLGAPEPSATFFWNDAAQWLCTRQEVSRVHVQTDAPLYRLGEQVRLAVQVYDERYAPLDGADVRLDIDRGALAVAAAPRGDGRYVADVPGLGPGDHAAVATAAAGGVNLGSSTAEFSVAAVGLEHEQVQQQKDLLEAIARSTGGGYASAARADSLLATIPLKRIAEERERVVSLGSSGWVLCAIVGLLAVEWVGRRVFGLL
jgi:hypothetical protein